MLAGMPLLAHALAALLALAAPLPAAELPATGAEAAATPAQAPEAQAESAAGGDNDDDADEPAGAEDAEAEASQGNEPKGAAGLSFTGDLSDQELQRRWRSDLASLGSISVGFADQGRMINAAQLKDGAGWVCQRPDLAFGTQETVDGLAAAFRAVHDQFPGSAPARLSHIGAREGGFLKPHRSHQAGRDADIGFFYKDDALPGRRSRPEKLIDPARNWALLRALITNADVQMILVDRSIQKVLRDYAIAEGEDRGWVDSLFHGRVTSSEEGAAPASGAIVPALIKHARRHRDHFHVRFYSPRSQELGRRIQPLLAERSEQNLTIHRVKRGQTLGHIAQLYATTVPALMKANRMRKSFLRLDQRLLVPLRKPCTRCPLPPALVSVPPRRLPPGFEPVPEPFVPITTTLVLRAPELSSQLSK